MTDEAALDWLRRWERMMGCYDPFRSLRHRLLFTIPDLPREAEARVLELNAGVGATAAYALEHLPNARILAVEGQPDQFELGQAAARGKGRADRVTFLDADVRQAAWWAELGGAFDLVVSATGLHWLSWPDHEQVYRRAFEALRPGGWLVNCDHMAADTPQLQERWREAWRQLQARRFATVGAETWDAFHTALSAALGHAERDTVESELWEGTDDGYPKTQHLSALRAAGFAGAEVHWQHLGEAVLAARKPG